MLWANSVQNERAKCSKLFLIEKCSRFLDRSASLVLKELSWVSNYRENSNQSLFNDSIGMSMWTGTSMTCLSV